LSIKKRGRLPRLFLFYLSDAYLYKDFVLAPLQGARLILSLQEDFLDAFLLSVQSQALSVQPQELSVQSHDLSSQQQSSKAGEHVVLHFVLEDVLHDVLQAAFTALPITATFESAFLQTAFFSALQTAFLEALNASQASTQHSYAQPSGQPLFSQM